MTESPKPTAVANLPEQPLVAAPIDIDPEKEVEFAQKCATALMKVIATKPRKVVINNEQYIEYEDWQTIARFYQISVGTEWTKTITGPKGVVGYGARAVVYNRDGRVISAAEAMCMRDEPKWTSKPEFQLRSMAQTRASAKALRNVLAWVVVMAGLKPTPAEEMDGYTPKEHRAPMAAAPAPQQPAQAGRPMTVPQKGLLTQLLREKRGEGIEKYQHLNSYETSQLIKTLLNEPSKPAAEDPGRDDEAFAERGDAPIDPADIPF